jgi:tetratricopeptide (TPR) repeat protein
MRDPSETPQAPEPAARELERRLNWGALPAILFLLMLASLAAIATYSTFAKPRTAHGMPDDPDITAARALLEGHMRSPAQDLRFTSALAGDVAPGPAAAAHHDPLAAARERLVRVLERHPLDPRVLTGLAHVELALRHGAAAESNYRLALEFTPHYGEARLGLGLALAQRSYRTTDALERRRLQLRALAQFAAVKTDDPAYECALFNRAMMAHFAGRSAEAQRLGDDYLSRDPAGPWAGRLRAALGRTG